MTVELERAGRRRLVGHRESLLLAVRDCPQPALARAALEQLAGELSSEPGEHEPGEPGVSWISEVGTDPRGHWLVIDAGDLPNRVVAGLAERLRELLQDAGVEQALVEVPTATRLLNRLLTLGPGAVLHLLWGPDHQRQPVPTAWTEPLLDWLGPADQMLTMHAMTLGMDLPLDMAAARPWLTPDPSPRGRREVLARLRDGSVRYVRTKWHCCGVASFGVAGGSLAALVEREVPRLRQLALDLAGQVTYAFLEPTPTYQQLFEVPCRSRPSRSDHMDLIDQVVVDAFPFQVLSQGHLAALGRAPDLQPAAGGRVSLDVGTFEDWLGTQRDELLAQGRHRLAPLLPDQAELQRRGQARLDERFQTAAE